MDLIPSLSLFEIMAYAPLLMLVSSTLFAFSENPVIKSFVNTTLVALKATEVVWRPALQFAVSILKPLVKALIQLAPYVRSAIRYAVNVTVTALRSAQSMGVSLTNAFPAVVQAFKDIGESLIILARGLGQFSYYLLRGTSLIVGSVESVFVFGKRLLFEAHLITMADLYNVMLPFVIVTGLLSAMYWFRKSPSEKSVQAFQPRRSSRIARKRAMMCMSDISDAFPASKKASATSTNL